MEREIVSVELMWDESSEHPIGIKTTFGDGVVLIQRKPVLNEIIKKEREFIESLVWRLR